MKTLVKNLISINQNNTVDKIGGDSKIGRAKFQANPRVKAAKSKNMVKSDFLAKFKFLVELNSGLSFFNFKARLIFTNLRQKYLRQKSFIILIQNAIFILKLIYLAMLLVKFLVS